MTNLCIYFKAMVSASAETKILSTFIKCKCFEGHLYKLARYGEQFACVCVSGSNRWSLCRQQT